MRRYPLLSLMCLRCAVFIMFLTEVGHYVAPHHPVPYLLLGWTGVLLLVSFIA
jgi:hypothetical protein